jgi:hypothetical protein
MGEKKKSSDKVRNWEEILLQGKSTHLGGSEGFSKENHIFRSLNRILQANFNRRQGYS